MNNSNPNRFGEKISIFQQDKDSIFKHQKGINMITVKAIDSSSFEVTVESSTTTIHHVTLKPSYYEKLTGKRVTPAVLVKKSFEFLLDRESNTSILRSFDLPVIGRYFPEYEREIKGML